MPHVFVWLILLTAPAWMPLLGGYTLLATRVLVLAMAAMGLNLLLGTTGALSFGQAAFFGLGGYAAGETLLHLAPSTPLALLIGMLTSGVIAAVLGPIAVRLRGIYFAMITIAFGQAFFFIVVNWNSFTGGEDGLLGFNRQPLHFDTMTIPLHGVNYYYLALFCFALVAAFIAALLRSPLGHAFVAIRENERRLQFFGVRAGTLLWIAFTISGLIAGLAGSLYALLNNFISPSSLHWTLSGDFVMMCVLGGMRSFWGPLLGAAIYVVAENTLSSYTDNWMSFLGLIFILIVLFFPKGVLGLLRARVKA
ncbi:branched-chain amino acid ABC transporter permease [Acidihalobacter ferrooxydans]|uniref:Branched-chain amino acid ABC transporter permease n=1 Tax=Acidihalobacter ferrooxydans TaxID=1765967 RepID=A0A1P8UL82_9GAMM|nr:branched-chain amino acid ABC transporter permease [Acidihalobacter ferrooxydans]